MNRWKTLLIEMRGDQRRWLVLRSLCALVWAVELFWVQGLAFEAAPWVEHTVLFQMIRFYLDLILTLSLSLLLQRRYLTPLLVLNAILLLILGTFALHFHRPMMISGIFYRWREAWSIRSTYSAIVPWHMAGVILVGFAAKFWLLVRSGRCSFPRWARWQMVALALFLYALPVGALQFSSFRLQTNSTNSNMRRAVYAYGYTVPWVIDIIGSLNLQELVERAKVYSATNYDRITPLERPILIKTHVLVLQLETIGTQSIESTYGGAPVMPFLRELRNKSMCFRIQAFHSNGSCDMDFAAVTFTRPYPFVVPYRLSGIEYTNSMPSFMKQHGFSTYVFHGNKQLFYDRGPLMEQLGFDHIFFEEQLANRHLKASWLGVRDAELLRCVLEAIQSEKRAYVFAITLDTHAPYSLLDESEMELFPRPTNMLEKYLNSARYLDHCVEKLINGLPQDTTVLIYGDHGASIKTDGFVSDVVEGKEYVACLIYQKGNDLSQWQQTRDQSIATNGMLNLLDALSYLRNSVEASDGKSSSAAAPLSQ